MSLASKSRLVERADMLAAVRRFFAERGVIEVDCPALLPAPSIDVHLEPFEVFFSDKESYYLHTSPEFCMKRLLCEGSGDIYQLGHVYRKGDLSSRHRPEFTMIEWYRLNAALPHLIEETVDLARLFLGELPFEVLQYAEIFEEVLDIHPFKVSKEILLQRFPLFKTFHNYENLELHMMIETLWGLHIEPALGKGQITVVVDFPPWDAQCARSKLVDGQTVSDRFELFYEGMELANGYNELGDAHEQHARLNQANEKRKKAGKKVLPVDTSFIASLANRGLPPCCGVAVGFDRLLMLKCGVSEIKEILPIN